MTASELAASVCSVLAFFMAVGWWQTYQRLQQVIARQKEFSEQSVEKIDAIKSAIDQSAMVALSDALDRLDRLDKISPGGEFVTSVDRKGVTYSLSVRKEKPA
jgi:hypothetical protein